MRNALEVLFPMYDKCGFCDRRSYRNGMCKLCLKEVEMIRGSICERYGRPMGETTLCVDCFQRKETYFMCNRSAVLYNDKMKEMLSLYKFRGQETLAYTFSLFLESAYRQYYQRIGFDYITFVPVHEERLKERGFNQAQQLAFQLSLRTKIPVISLLTKTKNTEKQSKKHRRQRLHTLYNAFHLRPFPARIKRVMLIDDVYTTGATVNECARVLNKAGIIVYSLTVAR